MKKIALFAFISSLFLVSCDPESSQQTSYIPLGDYDSGVLVLNQGNFNVKSSISYISFDLNTVQNDIFSLVNTPLTLDLLGQDIGFNDNLAYIVLSGSNKIQIVNRYTMENIDSIESTLDNPRYIVFANGKGYVTNNGSSFSNFDDDFITVFNVSTKAIVTTIPITGGSADKMIVHNGKIYVAQGGEYGTGNSIVVIDTTTDSISNSIAVGDSPNSLQIENNFLWVMCGGNSKYYPPATTPTVGKLLKINLNTNTIVKSYLFDDATKYPNNFTIYGENSYFHIYKDVYKMGLSETSLPTTPAFTTIAESPNAFAIKNNHIYIADALNFNSNGKVFVYSLGTPGYPAIGTLEKEHTVGKSPSGFYFNQ